MSLSFRMGDNIYHNYPIRKINEIFKEKGSIEIFYFDIKNCHKGEKNK
jgi:hypothetical protein